MSTRLTETATQDDWQEFEHGGQRWSFNADELAQLDVEDGFFHFVNYHRLSKPTVEGVAAFIDSM